jgi:hypothetical protein
MSARAANTAALIFSLSLFRKRQWSASANPRPKYGEQSNLSDSAVLELSNNGHTCTQCAFFFQVASRMDSTTL